jgi:hypothetical protein
MLKEKLLFGATGNQGGTIACSVAKGTEMAYNPARAAKNAPLRGIINLYVVKFSHRDASYIHDYQLILKILAFCLYLKTIFERLKSKCTGLEDIHKCGN